MRIKKLGKKKSRATQTSKGERRNVNLKHCAAVRKERDLANPFRRVKAQYAAYWAGKRVSQKFLEEQNLRPRHKDNSG